MGQRLTDIELLNTVEVYEACGRNASQAARELGVDRSTMRNRLARAAACGLTDETKRLKIHDIGEHVTIEGGLDRMVTPEDVLEASGLPRDRFVLEPGRCKVKTREASHAYDGGIAVIPKVEIELAFRKVVPDTTAAVMDYLAGKLPKASKTRKQTPSGHGLAVWGLYDAHIGMRSWGIETGEDYDIGIATETCKDLIDRVCSEADRRKVSRVVMPIGNDLIHVDNTHLTTTGKTANSGTHVDSDGRYPKMVAAGVEVADYAVQRAAHSGAVVELVEVPGNHDRDSIHWLMLVLQERYRNHETVRVVRGPQVVKVMRVNDVLLGFTHGDGPSKAGRKGGYLSVVGQDLWSGAVTKEVHTGHLHHKEVVMVDQYGVVMRQNSAIAASTTYEHRLGYVGASRGVQLHIYDDRRYRGVWEEYVESI